MSYIVQRKSRFYVVAYDGYDPHTGRERRRWHPAGLDRRDAEDLAARIAARYDHRSSDPATLGRFLIETWLPKKRIAVRSTTAYRYTWMVTNYILPTVGHARIGDLRSRDLDALYAQLLTAGGRSGTGIAAKTVREVHVIIRNALDLAVTRHLVATNVARETRAPRTDATTVVAKIWTPGQLGEFLTDARPHRLYPALHLAAHTGMRRGELAGLRWGDLDTRRQTLSISRTLQVIAGQPVEFDVKTRTSRRSIDLDPTTVAVLQRWRRRNTTDAPPAGGDDAMFMNTHGRACHPETFTQLFDRIVDRNDHLPRIRFHDLRHTHASLLIAHGVPVKVVSERLGHANPAFTMHTYQHLLPAMGAAAAIRFAQLLNDTDGTEDFGDNEAA